jgi:two-component system cell cycle sensor histidine kinase/response regulator CckA
MTTPPLMLVYNISARRFAEFFDSIPAAVFRTTIEGKIVYCNRAFAHTFGFDSALDLIDYPIIELYQNKKDRGALVHSIMQRGRLTDMPIAFKKKDKTPIWCAITARAVLDDDGMIINLDGTLRDITEEIDTQRVSPSLDGLVDELNDDKFQGVLEMAGGVAHSLSQPLTIINNLFNEILSELVKDGEVYQKIMKVHQQIIKMNSITKKIANIKKYEAMDYVAGVKIVDIDKAS